MAPLLPWHPIQLHRSQSSKAGPGNNLKSLHNWNSGRKWFGWTHRFRIIHPKGWQGGNSSPSPISGSGVPQAPPPLPAAVILCWFWVSSFACITDFFRNSSVLSNNYIKLYVYSSTRCRIIIPLSYSIQRMLQLSKVQAVTHTGTLKGQRAT